MTTVFIHGVPDTAAVWEPLRAALDVPDAVALSLPGFGCPLPEGFAPTKEAYADWIARELAALSGPLDVVAHDWGSILLVRVLATHPGLVRSWAAGGAPVTADYTWHPTARLWQTPAAGEKAMERFVPPLANAMLERAGLSAADAANAVERIDDTMKRCILSLYRSGREVFREWEPRPGDIGAPGLVLWGARDAYADPRFAERMAEVTGARAHVLDCGHWWQCEQPQRCAGLIRDFWNSGISGM